jgi:choline/glycine/proline betaine transport protein
MAIFIWLTIFGATALHEEIFGGGGITRAVQSNLSTSMYVLLERFPFPSYSAIFVLLAAVIFFVTSSDSGSLVVDFITTGGRHHPPVRQRIFWALLEGLVASALLLGGGLIALQTGSLVTGLPIAVVLLMVCYSLPKGLRRELSEGNQKRTAEIKEVVEPE